MVTTTEILKLNALTILYDIKDCNTRNSKSFNACEVALGGCHNERWHSNFNGRKSAAGRVGGLSRV